jgi:MarR family 2-MHQ and catechol resistance regulon transcriptional repressor
VDQLEKRGYVARERRSEDRRVVYAALTPAGRELIEEIFPEHAHVIAELFDVLTPEEQADMRRILKKLGLTVSANRGW